MIPTAAQIGHDQIGIAGHDLGITGHTLLGMGGHDGSEYAITHMVAPKDRALECAQCHADNGRLAGVPGVWMPGRDRSEGLDTLGFGLAGLMLLGVAGHGGLRFLMRKRRANNKGH